MLQTRVIGHYNVSNLLGVLATHARAGRAVAAAVRACQSLQPVPGRMQRWWRPGQPLVAVDYAHTPDALDKAPAGAAPAGPAARWQLWCVFGCGGDRDAGKRPLMGAVAQQHADRVVVTSDNPRSEAAAGHPAPDPAGGTHCRLGHRACRARPRCRHRAGVARPRPPMWC
jgi:UDP-N-acetylmuramoyl-L-alanyl-D-glutamate--2,6-diaminopimelate ligase